MAGQWFSPSTPVSSTNKTDRHDITEILLKVAINLPCLLRGKILTLHLIITLPCKVDEIYILFSFYGHLHLEISN